MKARAPVVGGNFGVWGGMFSTFDCAVKGWRKKEDAWNAIISGFMTGGCLALRSEFTAFSALTGTQIPLGGPKGAFQSAVACGILLGVFEGVGVLLGRVFSEGQRPQAPPCECTCTASLTPSNDPSVPQSMTPQPAPPSSIPGLQ
jgi:import inner membrane translocase subunit TIM17